MDSTNPKKFLAIFLLLFSYPIENQASSYDFRIAIILDSTKMTTLHEFQDQKTLVRKVLTKVQKERSIEYALAAYTADSNKIFKEFDETKQVNLTGVHHLEGMYYGFDPMRLFGLNFNKRPDCIWFIRNNKNYTHPDGNSTYVQEGYKDSVTLIALSFGFLKHPDSYLNKIADLADILHCGLGITTCSKEENLKMIANSINLNCKKYQPPAITITPSALLMSSSLYTSSDPTPPIPMTSTDTLNNQKEPTTSLLHTCSENMFASTSFHESLVGQSTKPTPSFIIPSVTSVMPSSEPTSIEKLLNDQEKLLNYNVKQMNLSNDVEFLTFVNRSSILFTTAQAIDATLQMKNVSYGWDILIILERFCIAVAEKMIENCMTEKSLKAKTENFFVHVFALDLSVFSGYEVGDVEVEKGKIKLPPEIFKKESGFGAIIVTMFDPVKLLKDGKMINGNSNATLAGKIINVEVLPRPENPLKKPVTIQILSTNKMKNNDASCVFWKTNLRGWSTSGCFVTKNNGSVIECQCNHMTHYAVLMSLDDQVISKKHVQVMTIITYVGCSVSIMAVFLTLIVFFFLPVLKSERTRVHCNLCFAIGSAQTLFLAAGSEELIQNTVICKLYAAVMLYFFISVFTWMLVEGIHLYQMVIIAFVSRPMMRFYYALGWGLPAMIVIIASAIAYRGYGISNFCWISLRDGTIWAFTGPAAFIILVNMFILISVLRLRVKLDISKEVLQAAKTGARVSIVLLPLLGMTWIFGFFSVVPGFGVVFQYLFSIANSLQGLMVFVFHCVGNSEVRKEFFRKAAQWNLSRKSFSMTQNTMTTNKIEPVSMESYDGNSKKN